MKNIFCFIIYCLFLCIVIILADTGRLPLYIFGYIPFYDKAAHFILYGVFYTLLDRMLMGKRICIFRIFISLSLLLTFVFIIGEEVSQIFLASRTFSLADLLMGFGGVLLFRFRSGSGIKVNPAGAYGRGSDSGRRSHPQGLPPC